MGEQWGYGGAISLCFCCFFRENNFLHFLQKKVKKPVDSIFFCDKIRIVAGCNDKEGKVMKDENKNQNEVKVLGYTNGEAEEAGNSENVKEICAILRTGAKMLKGKKIAEQFCDFVRGYCKKGKESAFLWGHDKKVNTLALDWMTTQLKGIWWSLDERHAKIKETMKWMLRVLWIDTERDGGFTTEELHRLFKEAGVIW